MGTEIDEQRAAGALSEECHRGFWLVLLARHDSPTETFSSRDPETVTHASKGDWASTGLDEIIDLGLSNEAGSRRWGSKLAGALEPVRSGEAAAAGLLDELKQAARTEPASGDLEGVVGIIVRLRRLAGGAAEPRFLK